MMQERQEAAALFFDDVLRYNKSFVVTQCIGIWTSGNRELLKFE